MNDFIKYPRTKHIIGSGIQKGDEDLDVVRLEDLVGKFLVIEEKLDAANCGISCVDGKVKIQSRGHFLNGSPRERHFSRLKSWVAEHAYELKEALGSRYVLFSEWMFAHHTVFYDSLPSYLMEFDIYDKEKGVFLSTNLRRLMTEPLGITPVPILFEGQITDLEQITSLVKPSLYKSKNWRINLKLAAEKAGLDVQQVEQQTDMSDLAEGLYIKIETEDETIGRCKYVRPDFISKLITDDAHWMNRPILPNGIASRLDEDDN